METLAPTVHDRLARCGTRVLVTGLVSGADVQHSTGPNTVNFTATSGARNVVVNPLQAGWEVSARQDAGLGFTPWSPIVIVEAVALPPDAGPILPPSVGACAQCIWVDGLVPGCEVELRQGNAVVGGGTANRHGKGCFELKLRSQREEGGGFLGARMIVCGQPGPDTFTPIVAEPALLPQPIVGEPIFGCQSVVPVTNIHPGTKVRLESDNGDFLGWFCSCWTAVNVYVLRPLVIGERVRAQCYWDGDSCKDAGSWSDWQVVIEPDEQITPELAEPLIEGDQLIRVNNQIEGASLLVLIKDDASAVAVEYGPRPASSEPEIALNEPLKPGNVVQVAQTLCGVTMVSNEVTVLPLPPQIVRPVIVPPLYECGAVVQVSNLHLGATVRIYQDGFPSGIGWAGMNTSIAVVTGPALVAGKEVTAKQWIGGIESGESTPSVVVQNLEELPSPVILPPLTLWATEVLVSRVQPGARVVVRTIGGKWLGEIFAGEPIVRVPVLPVNDTIQATVYLCDQSATSNRVVPIKSPCAVGSFPDVDEKELQLGEFNVSASDDSDTFTIDLMGQLYYPLDDDGDIPFDNNAPLVIFAHGYWDWNTPSYLGYSYLAKHLAEWGMIVFSVNLNTVNMLTGIPNTHQYARAEVILETLNRLLNHPDVGPLVNPQQIGLVGHSMGGEGVVVAQHVNVADSRGFGIRGVVSIAPTNYREEAVLRDAKYMQLFGTLDLLNASLSNVTGTTDPRFAGVRHYDRSWRDKTFYWIYGAVHEPFNLEWSPDPSAVLSPETHRLIARCLINAFFQDALLNQNAYAGYLEGVILPPSIAALPIYTQFSSNDARTVIDNFGDVDEQEGHAAEPVDKNSNTPGQLVADDGTLDVWTDLFHTTLDHSPHATKGVKFSWSDQDDVYISFTGGSAFTDGHWVSVRAAQFFEDAALNPANEAADLFMELSDGSDEAIIRLGSIATVPYPDQDGTVLSMMRSIRLPLNAFQAANPALDLNNIQRIRLLLKGRATGHILVDDIEFSR